MHVPEKIVSSPEMPAGQMFDTPDFANAVHFRYHANAWRKVASTIANAF